MEKQGIAHLLSITQLVQDKGKCSMQDYVCNEVYYMPISIENNVTPNPSCSCGVLKVQSISSMFVLNYQQYTKCIWAMSFRNHTTQYLLCSKPEFTNDENVSLFLKVQDLMIKSKRFE